MSSSTGDYRNLQIIGGLADVADGGLVRGSALAEHKCVSVQQAYRIIAKLADPTWDHGHPWVERVPGGIILTLDGRGVLQGIRRNPYTQGHKEQAWINRMRWPWLRKDSRTRAVIPKGKDGKQAAVRKVWRGVYKGYSRPR